MAKVDDQGSNYWPNLSMHSVRFYSGTLLMCCGPLLKQVLVWDLNNHRSDAERCPRSTRFLTISSPLFEPKQEDEAWITRSFSRLQYCEDIDRAALARDQTRVWSNLVESFHMDLGSIHHPSWALLPRKDIYHVERQLPRKKSPIVRHLWQSGQLNTS